ncbi:MAG: ferredoxin [Thermoproteus sp.]|jgi:ferredoxin|uniref:ferredoxin n=1 Tax=Thermoproteus sp. CP80 TaxID=1650659 RepID=UPI0009BF93CB|nr:ferredoxin [Thermoproteus sp. CP80]MCI4464658.1 ferredoxin [Thermoproteus sp.]MDT7869250.1 ferredoxin [Thermoproteus sp.]MDT7882229.1 ferredoxin [Thermoproteus sp.]PLC64999.1 ferredoxin [Thermoproteus sp. CP80]
MTARVSIDGAACFACGLCYVLAPNVFVEGHEGKAELNPRYRSGSPYEGLVPDELLPEAVRGMMTCPVKAIDVAEVDERLEKLKNAP